MYDEFILCDNGFKNYYEDGKVQGIEVKVRIGYYRGIPLSLFEDAYLKINGKKYGKDKLEFSVEGGKFQFEEMETVTDVMWNFTEEGTLRLKKEGGLEPGKSYEIEFMENIRVFYFPFPNISKCKKTLKLAE